MTAPGFVASFLGTPLGVRSADGALTCSSCTPARGRVAPRMAAQEKQDRKGQKIRRGGPGKTTKQRKPEGPYDVSVDMKGNPIWTMRTATAEDADMFVANSKLSKELVLSMLESSDGCSLVAELQEKSGSQPADVNFDPTQRSVAGASSLGKSVSGNKMKVVGGVLVFFQKSVVFDNSGKPSLVQQAEIAVAYIDPRVPDKEITLRRLALGSMKKMKSADVTTLTNTLSRTSTNLPFYKSIGMEEDKAASTDTKVTLTAKLLEITPDPQKKISS